MQRQKTIAKWLAILLLLTCTVACYIVFGTSLGKGEENPSQIAGADGDNSGVPSPPEEQIPEPVYSEFPRIGEKNGNSTLHRVGGEEDERLLDMLRWGAALYALFSSDSTQYDVRGKGIYIAIIEGDVLKGTKLICNDEEYVCSTLTVGGLLIVTRSEKTLALRLFDSECIKICEATTLPYKYIRPFTDGDDLILFVNDGENLSALTISPSLKISKSNFVYPLAGSVEYAFKSNGKNVLIIQTQSGIGIVTFSTNGGFTFKSELLNCQLQQIMPSNIDGKAGFALLALSGKGLSVNTLDADLQLKTTHVFEGIQNGILLKNGDNYVLLTGKVMQGLCSHFEWQYSSELFFDDKLSSLCTANYLYKPIEGETDKCVMIFENSFVVAAYDNGKLSAKVTENGRNPYVLPFGNSLYAGFEATKEGGFGKNDVYVDVNDMARS